MQYISTRNREEQLSASQAVLQGLAGDGGLLVPVYLPKLPRRSLETLRDMSYQQRAVYVMKLFLDEFSVKELTDFANKAYGPKTFDTPAVAPVRMVSRETGFLELWHGPTCAFQDMSLQVLPQLLQTSLQKKEEDRTLCLLAATSGHTGIGALRGFQTEDRAKVAIFYPKEGVSPWQILQMTTQEGANLSRYAVEGTFDQVQQGVKSLLLQEEWKQTLEEKGYLLSTANSINWGRVLPQIVYYISAYCDMLRDHVINLGDPVNFSIPTGNFSNILAAYYAKDMGLPVQTLICASNANQALTNFFQTGCYDVRQSLKATLSPGMDLLIASNLERLLFAVTQDEQQVQQGMDQLEREGYYQVPERVLGKLQRIFSAYACDDHNTQRGIGEVYRRVGYLMDPHTAVAFVALEKHRQQSGDRTPSLVVSTASPFQFCETVLSALGGLTEGEEREKLERLQSMTGQTIPASLWEACQRAGQRDPVIPLDGMGDGITEWLT